MADNIISLEEREQRQFEKYCEIQGLPSPKEQHGALERWIEEGLQASAYVLREKAEELPLLSGLMEFVLFLESTPGHGWIDKQVAAKLVEQSAKAHCLAKRLLDAAIREEKGKIS